MVMINKEYYVLEPDFFNTGLVDFDHNEYLEDASDLQQITYCKPANIISPLRLKFEDEQEQPTFTDIMHGKHPILNNRLLDIIYPLDLYGSQIFSATIRDRENINHNNYFMWYVCNCIDCLDLSKSGIDPDSNNSRFLEFMSLDPHKLLSLRKDKRIAFRLKDNPDKLLLHKDLVSKLNVAKLSGVKFIPVDAWGWDRVV